MLKFYSVRLVDGADLCSGRLEVKSNLSWSSVSAAAFDQQDAAVVCRELNCGAPSVLQGALYGESDTVLNKEFRCEGQELALLDCDSSVRQHAGPAVGLNCSEPEDVRLVGGSRCAGTLELRRRGEWKPAYTDSWTLQFAGEVCRQLDCGSAVSTRKRKTPEQDMWRLTPDCGDSGILTCATKFMFFSGSIEITCLDSVRLVNGTGSCSGRLEVESDQLWSPVCEADFAQQDAEVVCRQLSCGAPLVLQGALYGEAGAPGWSREFHCKGNESELLGCGRNSTARNSCPGRAVGLTCSDPLDGVRLVGGASRCSGNLQVEHGGGWKHVISGRFAWSMKETDTT
ncbi:scavenger receptor cysteine-rich type 1 protein M130-like [Odontesthes bonariensis]